jgi:hypothetical protein
VATPATTAVPSSLPSLTAVATATPAGTIAASDTPPATPGPLGSGGPSASPTFDILGLLTATIGATNLGDGDLTVKVAALDPDAEELVEVTILTLRPFESISEKTFAARYRIEFQAGIGAAPQVCAMDLRDGDDYTFVALAKLITVSRAGTDAAAPADLVVASSGLCHAWSGTP